MRGMFGRSPKPLTRSFCGKSERETRQLRAGPRVFICDACVDACAEILRGERAKQHCEFAAGDVVLSGGICPNCYSAPVILTDVYSLALNGGALTVSQITATANPGYIGSEQETTTNTAPENSKITHLDFSTPAAVVLANGATGTATAVTTKFTDLGTFTCPNT